jgi:hypothetical protein
MPTLDLEIFPFGSGELHLCLVKIIYGERSGETDWVIAVYGSGGWYAHCPNRYCPDRTCDGVPLSELNMEILAIHKLEDSDVVAALGEFTGEKV